MSKKKRTKQIDSESDDQQYSYESEEEENRIFKPNKNKNNSNYGLPMFFKYSNEATDISKISINVSSCHYPVVTKVAKQLGWAVNQSPTESNWDVFWTDKAITSQQLFRLLSHQKINHYPGMYVLARKNCLGKALMKMRKQAPQQYNFFPLTWMVPSELNEFSVHFNAAKADNLQETYIVKPEASCQGRGILLTRKIETIQDEQPCIVQKYITKPYLIDGLKFDFRIYVLLAGTDPMRIFVYKQGLARFATTPYKEPQGKNLKQSYMHLTNYAINKQNPDFVFNKDSENDSVGHKRSLSSVYKLLESKMDVPALKKKINDLIIKTIITGQPLLSHLYHLSQPDNYANDMCFQILGFDVIIQQDGQPKLLQVNHTPSFVTDTPLDENIKKNCIKDALTLMNINIQSKSAKVKLKKDDDELRAQRKRAKLTPLQKQQAKLVEQRIRDQYESLNSGGYEKIYPTADPERSNMYKQLLNISSMLFNKANIKRKAVTLTTIEDSRTETSSPSKNLRIKTQLVKDGNQQLPTLRKSKFKGLRDSVQKMEEELGTKESDHDESSRKASLSLQKHANTVQTKRDPTSFAKKLTICGFVPPSRSNQQSRYIQNQLRSFNVTMMKMQKIKNLSLGLLNDIKLVKAPSESIAVRKLPIKEKVLGVDYATPRIINFDKHIIAKEVESTIKNEKRMESYSRFIAKADIKQLVAAQHHKLNFFVPQ